MDHSDKTSYDEYKQLLFREIKIEYYKRIKGVTGVFNTWVNQIQVVNSQTGLSEITESHQRIVHESIMEVRCQYTHENDTPGESQILVQWMGWLGHDRGTQKILNNQVSRINLYENEKVVLTFFQKPQRSLHKKYPLVISKEVFQEGWREMKEKNQQEYQAYTSDTSKK